MSSGLLVQESNEILLGATSVVGLTLLAAGGEEFDGRVGADALFLSGALAALGISINLGDDDVDLVLKVVCELFPCRGEVLAV